MRNPTIDPTLPARSAAAVVLASTIFAVGLLLAPSAAAQVYRCEGADGRITYTNERCPGTARRTLTVDDSPPVQTQGGRPLVNTAVPPEGAVAKADNQSPGTGAAKAPAVKSDPAKDRAKDAAPASATAAGGTAIRLGTAANLSPAQQMEQLDQERDRQRRACDQMERRIAFARNDFESATDGRRASYELQLRRLQEDYLVQCPMQR
jgi:Domain of unknown function (DUF4124)